MAEESNYRIFPVLTMLFPCLYSKQRKQEKNVDMKLDKIKNVMLRSLRDKLD